MGSCSSGGPNKLAGMCMTRHGDDNSQDEDNFFETNSQQISHQNSNSAYRTRMSRYFDARHDNSSSGFLINDQSKSIPQHAMEKGRRTLDNGSGGTTNEDGNSVLKFRHQAHSLNCDRARLAKSMAMLTDRDDSTSFRGHSQSLSASISCTDKPTSDISASNKRILPSSPNTNANVASRHVNSTKAQQRHRHGQSRNGSPVHGCYRWPGEYSNCIVAPPNKTVFDALSSEYGRMDYAPDSDWALCTYDQKPSIFRNQHPPSSAAITGYDCVEKKSTPTGSLPLDGLRSSASHSSYYHGSTSSTSLTDDSESITACLFRRKETGSGNGAKRSSSVGSSCPSTSASTAELLRGITKNVDDSVVHRGRTSNENRPLVSASRLLNLLSSPMKPLNRGDSVTSPPSSATTKYVRLNSEVSADLNDASSGTTSTSTKTASTAVSSNNTSNTVSNKNSSLER